MLNTLEDIVESTRHDTALLHVILHTSHCVGLTSTSLPIGKDGPVIALKDVCDDRSGRFIIDLTLGVVPVEYPIESELLWGLFDERPPNENLPCLSVQLDDYLMPLVHLLGTKGSAADANLDALCLVVLLLRWLHFLFKFKRFK